MITAYADLRPIVLWGHWLDSEVIIGWDPVITRGGLDAADCWTALSAWPRLPSPSPAPAPDAGLGGDGVGGGWFVALGYEPGNSWLAFCDSVLRRRADGSWVFESLGLGGREEATAAALSRAQAALGPQGAAVPTAADAGATRSGIGPLGPVDAGEAADAHLAGVERVIGRIRAGEVYQLNLCTRFRAELTMDPYQVFLSTAGAVRPQYGAHLPTGPEQTLVSLSPERFLTVGGDTVITSPIKGTTKRSEDPDGSLLRSSTKDAAENIMITDLMRNDLSRVCAPGSVAVAGLLEVQPHPGVWHLVSTVTGRLPPGSSGVDLLTATFPPGSVTGAPKSSAIRAIAAEEQESRGAYTGAAGLLAPDGRAELSVLIRTFEIDGGSVQLGVGGGITVDSVPVREWQECLHKAEPLALAAGSGLVAGLDRPPPPRPPELVEHGVFESILAQHGRPLRLADHLARLARSVRELYAAELPTDLTARVLAVAAGAPTERSALRVRAQPHAGALDVDVSVRPLSPRMRTCALVRGDRLDQSWRHKWVDRHDLLAAEERAAPALPYFLDPRGRLAETSRGNLFVLGTDDRWRTPPSGDDQLPGVTRRALLDTLGDHAVDVEIVPIAADDLTQARSVVWTSSLSGVVGVELVDGRPLVVAGCAARWSRWLGIETPEPV
ncbi:MAG TPA: bifunctional anthranilate synthase component I family protein/class IV aminotransferase [Microlunatus sp.]|nr:bifunctional anthranilate synthase component I family protein/class IV aminotransferase [Microlunatus sp.]